MADPAKAGNPPVPAPAAQPAALPVVPIPPVVSGGPTPTPAAVPQPGVTPPAAAAGQPTLVPLAALQEERDKRQSLQAEVENLKKLVSRPGLPGQVQPVQPAQPTVQDLRQQLDQLWETDPRRAVQAELMAAINWRDQIEVAVDMQEEDLNSRFPDFNTYRGEIRRYVRSLPLEQRANPGVVELAYYAVRGQQFDTIVNAAIQTKEQELLQKYQQGGMAQGLPAAGAAGAPAIPAGQVQLTPEQKAVCVAMHIPEVDYIKYIPGVKT